MVVVVSQLVNKISNQGVDEAKAGLAGMSSQVDSSQASLRNLAMGGLAIAGTALIAVGVQSVKMAGDFQASLTGLSTGAGEAQSNLKMVGDGLLKMSVDTGTGTKALTDGMFMIESAGYHGAQGLNVLKVAAEGARVGNADLGVVSNAMTTFMQDYHVSADHAAISMNFLTAVVANGKTHLSDLAGSLSSILPIASAYGISAGNVGGAIATMTNAGMSAQNATQNLANAVRALETPNGMAVKSLAAVGLKSQEVASTIKNKGLPDAIELITHAVGKKFPEGSVMYNTAMEKIMGGATGLNVALMLGGKNMDSFRAASKNVADAMTSGGDKVTGWSQVQGTFNFKMDQAKATLETLGIKIGTALLPQVGKLVDGFSSPAFQQFATTVAAGLTTALTGLITTISTLVSVGATLVTFFHHNQAAMVALQAVLVPVAGMIAGLLVFAFYSWAAAAAAAAIATMAAAWPFILIGALIAVVVAGIVLAIMHWGEITKWFQGVWGAVSAWFSSTVRATGSFFVSLWTSIADFFKSLWAGIVSGLQAAWAAITNAVKVGALAVLAFIFAPFVVIGDLFIELYKHNIYFQMLIDAIVGYVKAGTAWLVSAWKATSDWLVGAWRATVNFATSLWRDVSRAIQSGFSAAVGFVQSVWSTISSFFVNAWSTYISGPLTSLWRNVSNVFSSAWSTYISGPISSLWGSLSSTISGWAGKAVEWGKNVIQGLINGITSMAGNVGNAVGDIAAKIGKFLGFHSPTEEGVGREADQWAPNLVHMFASGLETGIPQIESAVAKLANPIGVTLNARSGIVPSLQPSGSASSSDGAGGPITIILELDGHQFGRVVMQSIADNARLHVGVRI